MYITTDVSGGRGNPTETVLAGGQDAHGDASAPYELKWTPTATTPDTVYYQCYTHAKFGWKIIVSEKVELVVGPTVVNGTVRTELARIMGLPEKSIVLQDTQIRSNDKVRPTRSVQGTFTDFIAALGHSASC